MLIESSRWVCVLVIAAALPLTAVVPVARATDDRDKAILELPLDHGVLHVRDLLQRMCDEIGLSAPDSIKRMTWTIDVKSTLGRMQLNVLDRLADGAFTTSVRGDRVVIAVDKDLLRFRIREAGSAVSSWLAELMGGVQEHQPAVFGLTFVTDVNSRTPIAEVAELPSRVVVLVHGLDDPGFMWRDLIPALRGQGLTVARFEYPNDGPISDSADLLAAALRGLREREVEHVDIVAHSMGGLVTRDVLTRKAFYDGDGAGSEELPAVDRFIMLGTPNHGSNMARLRGLGELREHLYRAFNGDVPAFSFGDDGDGEAAIDLLPDSDFLRRLNARPLPTHTVISIVAAQWSPVDGSSVKSLVRKVQELAGSTSSPKWLRDLANSGDGDAVALLMTQAVYGLGDGCVTIDSTRIEGVEDFELVRGNHLSMIVNITSKDVVPPAVPIVVNRLAASLPSDSPTQP
jgi:pimeloyl-ACP methyl ester carboxylesterase